MIQLIRGFKDILPGEVELWQAVEKVARELLEDFGFKEIRIPIMERTELFARSIGEETDIVEKEMYTFPDRKGDLITLVHAIHLSRAVMRNIKQNLWGAFIYNGLGLPVAALNLGRTRADAQLSLKLVGDCGRLLPGIAERVLTELAAARGG